LTRSAVAHAAAAVLVAGLTLATAAPAHGQTDAADATVTVDKHLPYVTGGAEQQTLDVYREEGSTTGRPALVLVHGGGFAGGTPDDLSRQARLAADQGWVAFNLDYRGTIQLGTDGEAWPAELDDVTAGIRWVLAHATEYGADPSHLALLGASAGGTLAGLAAADATLRIPVLGLWSAPTDLAPLVPAENGLPPACGPNSQCIDFWRNPWVTNLFGCTPEECPHTYDDAAVVNHAGSLPPTYIANATAEVVPIDQARRLDSSMRAAGISTQLQEIDGSRHAQTYTESVWNDTMTFFADELGVPPPKAIDFGDSPFDFGWGTVAALAAVVGIVVAVVARIVSDRRRGRVV
jgi:acetyl esterase/lipase